MSEKFAGFSPAAFQFLRDLGDNNQKEWFQLHKPDYEEYVLKPLQALVAGLGPLMLSIDSGRSWGDVVDLLINSTLS